MRPALLAGALLLIATTALAQGRPDEDALFGAPAPADAPQAPPPPAANAGEAERPGEAGRKAEEGRPGEEAIFGGAPIAEEAREVAPEDPLKIGGQFYLRSVTVGYGGKPASQWQFSQPTLVDAYFDARPNERVRGFVLGRLRYDPSVAAAAPSGAAPAVPVTIPGMNAAGPLRVDLDQLWLRFDVARTVFVTAGRQHVKWGPARFWNPTDFLHQVRRDPLAVFDARLGTTLLKLHLPWERRGWNFYGVGVLEDSPPADALGKLAGGGRAELVFGVTELGVSVLAQRSRNTRVGLDVSSGLGPIDVYAEAALRNASDATVYRSASADPISEVVAGAPIDSLIEARAAKGVAVGATAGLDWQLKYSDEDVLTLGAEYFYNSLGVTDAKLYPLLMFKGAYTPFYVGRHYLGLFAVLAAPGRWNNTSFTLSNVANLTDTSGLVRLDYSVLVLTHLRFEAYGAAQYGKKGAEFHFGLDVPALGLSVPAPDLQAGVGLRVAL